MLKSNLRNKNWIVDTFTQVKSAEHMVKNQFQMHILWFFFHDDVKMYRTPLLKTFSSLTIKYRMYLKILQNPLCLGGLKTSQALLSAV